ncbi:hypothetical protein MBLNU459_g1114t1 [Dothideomycetes sp. NU459]
MGTPQSANALNHLVPISLPGASPSPMSSMLTSRHSTPPSRVAPDPCQLPKELLYDPTLDTPRTSILEYLTSPNPSPSLVHRVHQPAQGQNTHFWYDVRNLRSWSDFNTTTIANIPDFLRLLELPEIPVTALPVPPRVDTTPESQAQLHELCRDYFAVKVNAALKVTQGQHPMVLRSLHSSGPTTGGTRQHPEFLSNCTTDTEKTIASNSGQRGRIVGIVKCYDQWNSGMRAESPARKVNYLSGLAQLHLFMREHGCRYGFIMTEIELVCVRYGGDGGDAIPNFGFLELSDPIRLCTHGATRTNALGQGSLQMTALLALLWLHVLAKNQMVGQQDWRLDVGGPAAVTRHKHLPRDDWMPKPNLSETRMAKRNRGWVWPDEPLSKRECGRGRRHVARK